ncbi:MAG: hypothetical protein WAZ18_00010 [Alphaproteobacteria bacterium]
MKTFDERNAIEAGVYMAQKLFSVSSIDCVETALSGLGWSEMRDKNPSISRIYISNNFPSCVFKVPAWRDFECYNQFVLGIKDLQGDDAQHFPRIFAHNPKFGTLLERGYISEIDNDIESWRYKLNGMIFESIPDVSLLSVGEQSMYRAAIIISQIFPRGSPEININDVIRKYDGTPMILEAYSGRF